LAESIPKGKLRKNHPGVGGDEPYRLITVILFKVEGYYPSTRVEPRCIIVPFLRDVFLYNKYLKGVEV
jgi:hypothetical protein